LASENSALERKTPPCAAARGPAQSQNPSSRPRFIILSPSQRVAALPRAPNWWHMISESKSARVNASKSTQPRPAREQAASRHRFWWWGGQEALCATQCNTPDVCCATCRVESARCGKKKQRKTGALRLARSQRTAHLREHLQASASAAGRWAGGQVA
jgi:hypothetical protein